MLGEAGAEQGTAAPRMREERALNDWIQRGNWVREDISQRLWVWRKRPPVARCDRALEHNSPFHYYFILMKFFAHSVDGGEVSHSVVHCRNSLSSV